MNERLNWIYVSLTVPFILCMTVVNLFHPAFHALEGGQVDMTIDYLTAIAAQINRS